MANLYIGPDGVIHNGNGNGVRDAVSVNTGNTRNTSESSYYNSVSYVGTGRKVWYWIFSIAVGIVVGIGLYHLFGSSVFATYEAKTATEMVENWFWGLASWVFVIGGCAGSICYGVSFAPDRDYDLGAFLLSVLSAVGGVIVLAIALAAVCGVVVLFMYMIGIILGVMIAVVVIAGLCSG